MFNTAHRLHFSHKVWKSTVRTHERTRGRKVASSSPVATEDPPYKWVRGSVSTFWCSVVGKGSLAQVSSSSLDPGSKLEVRPNGPSVAQTATARSDVVQSGRPIFDDFFQHLWPYIGNNTANVVFQMVRRLWLIRIDQ
ncbi:hypothetical protein TNCV_1395021 [Trichonephila clavipes]|nr:hypothetical protein TNCV_1395021 [Trichonephila clavipes]